MRRDDRTRGEHGKTHDRHKTSFCPLFSFLPSFFLSCHFPSTLSTYFFPFRLPTASHGFGDKIVSGPHLLKPAQLPMGLVALHLLPTESTCHLGVRTPKLPWCFAISPTISTFSSFRRICSVPFATLPARLRHSSSMASESINSSQEDVRERREQRSMAQAREGTPYAARAAAGAAAAPSFFPMGYREGFSQWVILPPNHIRRTGN